MLDLDDGHTLRKAFACAIARTAAFFATGLVGLLAGTAIRLGHDLTLERILGLLSPVLLLSALPPFGWAFLAFSIAALVAHLRLVEHHWLLLVELLLAAGFGHFAAGIAQTFG